MIDTPAKVQRVLELGAYSVVVGSVIHDRKKLLKNYEKLELKQNQA